MRAIFAFVVSVLTRMKWLAKASRHIGLNPIGSLRDEHQHHDGGDIGQHVQHLNRHLHAHALQMESALDYSERALVIAQTATASHSAAVCALMVVLRSFPPTLARGKSSKEGTA